MALINKLGAIGNAIREKTGSTELLTLDAMPAKILSIETGGSGGGETLPEEAFTITGNCSYRFAYGGWDWFIKHYRNRIKTEALSDGSYMFTNSSQLEEIPFDINLGSSTSSINLSGIFRSCSILKSIPKIKGRVNDTNEIFSGCLNIRELPEEVIKEIDWSYVDGLNAPFGGGNRAATFQYCYSLRSYPNSFLAHGNPAVTYFYSIYYNGFFACTSLDEIVNLPIQHRNATWTSNAFYSTFTDCYRLKRVTFETNEDGSPIKINTWSKQSIDLKEVGRSRLYENRILNYNSGITEATQVLDDATYQALKDNPDWWTKNLNYSRYNHDSAVETINTLPDLSGGAGGNTIKFTGVAGALTDGGAINTMTEEEIAVAAAKGWTVTFV